MYTTKKMASRLSVALAPDIYAEISARAEHHNLSLNRVVIQLLRAGLEAENQKNSG